MTEEAYARVTHDMTMAAADTLCRLNPKMTFIYVSGAGTDSSEHGRAMWARVREELKMRCCNCHLRGYRFRPGVIEPLHGARSKTASYRVFYTFTKPLLPVLRWAFPNYVLTTEQIGRAMLAVARHGFPKRVLESKDIRSAGHP